MHLNFQNDQNTTPKPFKMIEIPIKPNDQNTIRTLKRMIEMALNPKK